MAVAGCSDLTNRADATVVLQAEDQPAVLRIRQDLLDQAPSWGGIRVGETSTEQDGSTALTFSLPGQNLDAALGGVGRVGATIESTSIDVDPEQVDRNAPTTTSGSGDAGPERIRLRVEIAADSTEGAGALLRLVMALFSVVGMVATALWIVNWWRRRHGDAPGDKPARIVDITGDPPTQETPQVPHDPW